MKDYIITYTQNKKHDEIKIVRHFNNYICDNQFETNETFLPAEIQPPRFLVAVTCCTG